MAIRNIRLEKDEILKKVGLENGPKIMLAAHMDEVGMIVSKITPEGFIKFQTVGDWWSQVMLAQKVTITTRTGKKYRGVLGSIPPHILTANDLKNPVKIEDTYIDLGVSSQKEVEDLGINIGDMITPYLEFEVMNNEDYLDTAKTIYEFTKANDFYKIKAGIIDGKVMTAEEIITLAKLPSKETLIGMLAGALLGTITKFAVAVDQVRLQKEA